MQQACQIVATLTEEGQIGIQATGPGSESKLVILGLLDMVKEAVMQPQQPQPQPQPASPILLARGGLPNGRGRAG